MGGGGCCGGRKENLGQAAAESKAGQVVGKPPAWEETQMMLTLSGHGSLVFFFPNSSGDFLWLMVRW